MIEIKVLGSGCANCKKVEALAHQAVDELSLEATFEKVTDYNQIMSYDILSTPGLVINGKVVSYGRIPRVDEIKGWLKEAQASN
jgi:small redox-active disulfide protein 2